MADKIFVDGFYLKTITTEFGEILSLGIKLPQFSEFVKKHKNGDWMNIDIQKGPSGKKYAALNTFRANTDGSSTQGVSDDEVGQDECPDDLIGEDEIPF